MALIDHAPRLDNRRFEEILREARARIPRYAPEWTDLNDSDPGMALVQLGAWMTELLLYRMNRVPDLNYLKFLELIGIELKPAEPARAEITFPVEAGFADPFVIVPMRQQVMAESDDEPMIFETERSLTALRAALVAVQRRRSATYELLTPHNDAAAGAWDPFGPRPAVGDELLLGFSEAIPAGVEIDLSFFDAEPVRPTDAVACGPLPAAQHGAGETIAWEMWDGAGWRALDLLRDDTGALTRTGHLSLRVPTGQTTAAAVVGRVADALHWFRARLLQPYEQPPRLLAVRTNTVEAQQAQTVEGEVLGRADATPNQRVRLAFAPVLAGTLQLTVDEGETAPDGTTAIEWTEVPDFLGSNRDARHYVLNRTSGEVTFGDGVNGRIPLPNPDRPNANIVASSYRYGGGEAGNVAAGTLNTPLLAIEGIDAGSVTNLRAARGGRNEESLAEARRRASGELKSRDRAVTAEDFEQHARAVGGVKRAKALPLHHPAFPETPIPGAITVIVVPGSADGVPNPVPSQALLRAVCEYLDQRRLLTTEVYVVGPTYRRIEVRADVIAADNADLREVREGVERALLDYLHPLRGGERGEGWPFGRTVFYSQVFQRLFDVPGVARIGRLTLADEGREAAPCEDIDIAPTALVYSTTHRINVTYETER